MDQVAEIKQKLDIVDVVGSYVSLKKSGRNYKAVCPFHSEKTPSFMVSPELQIYKCFGCGAGGDIFNFVQEIEGVEFAQALEQLAEKAGIKLVKNTLDTQSLLRKKIYLINDLSAKFFSYLLIDHKSGKKALDYLKKERKINENVIKEFRLGYAPNSPDSLIRFLKSKGLREEDILSAGVVIKTDDGRLIDKFRGRVMFPLISVDGKIAGFTGRTIIGKDPKYLNTPETPVFHKTFFIFGLDKNRVEIKKNGAIFVEGQMDLISAYQSGIKNLVSVSGTSLTDNQLKILSRYTNNVTFCFDSDFAGINASYRAIELAEKQGFNIKIAIIPEPYKDLDEVMKDDPKKAQKIIDNSVSAYDYFFVTVLKKYNKSTALGKKNIMEDLIPIFSKITNEVMLDHYAKKISSELDITLETVFNMLRKGEAGEGYFGKENNSEELFPVSKRNSEAYFLSLVLKAPIDIAPEYGKKLDSKDFLNEKMGIIYKEFQNYIKDRKSDLNIKSFLKLFDEETQKIVTELFLWDVDLETEEDVLNLKKDLDSTVDRIKKDSVKRQLKDLSAQIKISEAEKSLDTLEKLTKKFEKLSKDLM